MQEEVLNSQPKLLQLEPREIDCQGSWLFWLQEPGVPLLRSLQELGQLEPVLVRRSGQAWELVSGYKRCKALQQLGSWVWAREIQGQEIQMGLVRLQSNLGLALSPEGLIAACRYFQARMQEKELQSFLQHWIKPLLAGKQWPLVLSWLVLPLDYDQALQEARLPLEIAPRLQRLDPAALKGLLPIFLSLTWSGNQARNLLDWLLEAAEMQGKSPGLMLEDLNLSGILQEDLSPKDAKERILDRIKDRRFPWLQTLDSEFKELCRQLQARHWRIQPERNFETDALYLQARIQSARELWPAVQELQEVLGQEAWTRLKRWQTERFYPK
ncbi:MAG: ParB N-terminal domain-containing protein [Desulfohalobiaceae bacterium]